MAQKFVPLDLDKLLDDFENEEQDSITSPAKNKHVSLHESGINKPLTSCRQESYSPVHQDDREEDDSSCFPGNNAEKLGEINGNGMGSTRLLLSEISQISERLSSQMDEVVPKTEIHSGLLCEDQSTTSHGHLAQNTSDEIDPGDLSCDEGTAPLSKQSSSEIDGKYYQAVESNHLSRQRMPMSDGNVNDLKRDPETLPNATLVGQKSNKLETVSSNTENDKLCSMLLENAGSCLRNSLSADNSSKEAVQDENSPEFLLNTRDERSFEEDTKIHQEQNIVDTTTSLFNNINQLAALGATKTEKTFDMVTTNDQVALVGTRSTETWGCEQTLTETNERASQMPVSEQPASEDAASVEHASVELVSVEPVSVKPVYVQPLSVGPVSVEPGSLESAPVEPALEDPSLYFLRDHFSNININEEQGDQIGSTDQGQDDIPASSSQPDNCVSLGAQFVPVAQDVVTESSSNNYLRPGEPFQLGYSPPQWMPDNEARRCTNCQCKFTVVKRRHHCRACGKIFCAPCCNLKFNLHYMQDKLVRVCQACANTLLQRQATLSNQDDASVPSNDQSPMYLYLSPEHRAGSDTQPVEPSPVFSEPEDDTPFYYDTMPGQELSSTSNDIVPMPHEGTITTDESSTQLRPTTCSSSSSLSSGDVPVTSTIPLPPIIRKTADGLKIDNEPNHQEILYLLKKKKETVCFLLNKNLVVRLQIVKLNCCAKRKCWCFSSEGMGAADQEDMVILLEYVSKESSIPQDVLSHFNTAFAYAKEGHRVTDLGYTIFGQPFLGSLRNAGFLYIKSSFQCLENLILPSGPHIFGILIQRAEVSWVQLFPIRLILRLGAEYRYYPCPLWSVRDREALYGDVGHTIMDLLADFKNFQYTLPRVTGMHVHLEDKRTVIQLPQNRYDEVVKVLNATDEYVMAFEATFSNVADSHLVCIQEGSAYKTQAVNIEGHERKITGASFVVFNGALKATNDVKAKVSIVEDGVMIQMVMQLSQEMRQAMREMRDFTINTGCPSDGGAVQEVVIEWVTKRTPESEIILSPIDGIALGTATDIKINTHFDYTTPSIHRLRWSQLFFIDKTEERPRNLSPHFKESTAGIAKGCTMALRPHLASLAANGKDRIGLRVNLNPDMVGYTIGSQGTSLPDEMINALDNELVPALNNAVNPSNSAPTFIEFVFNIIDVLS